MVTDGVITKNLTRRKIRSCGLDKLNQFWLVGPNRTLACDDGLIGKAE